MATTSSILAAIASAAGLVTSTRFGVQIFTASGSFARPSGVSSVTAMVLCIGGGGGGGTGEATGVASGNVGSAGGNTTFGALATGTGGSPGKGGNQGTNASNGYSIAAANQTSTIASTVLPAHSAVPGFLGIGAGGAGGIGPQSATQTWTGNSGNSGGVGTYFGTVSADETVTIGAGGAPGTATTGGISTAAAGQKGACIVFYWW